MARKPATSPLQSETPRDSRTAVIDALMTLAAEREWEEIGLPDLAERAGIGLSELRGLFPSKGAVLAAFSRQVDQRVLDGIDPAMAAEPARERLFDTLMRRVDVLAPHKEAVRRISRAILRDPLALAAWNRVVVSSMQWMLVAANIDAEGPLGAVRAQGLALAWSRIIRAWLADDDEGLGRTMTEIDRQLRSGERWMERADDLWQMARPFRRIAERSMQRRARLRERMRERFAEFRDRERRRDRDGDDARAV